MPPTADAQYDELKRKARRRLVGAVVLALAAAVFVPMLLESDERPLGDDVSVRIPPVDQGKFVNRLNAPAGTPPASTRTAPSKSDAGATVPAPGAAATSAPGTAGSGGAAASAPASATDAGKGASAPSGSATPRSDAAAPHADTAAPHAAAAPPPSPVPTPAKAAAAPAKPAPDAAVKAAPAKAGGYVVQLAAFSDDKGANALANRLRKSGHPAFTEPVTTSRGTLWRVRVGPYATRDEANTARDKLKREGQNGIVAARAS
jgi:DedD protein